MTKTFQHEVKYLEVQPIFKEGADVPEYSEVVIEKLLTFKELNQLDREQHDLHFLIMAYYSGGTVKTKGKRALVVDPEFARDMTNAFLNDMLILDKEFTATDKEIMMNDSGCLIKLGMYLIPEKVLPFFLKLTKSIAA